MSQMCIGLCIINPKWKIQDKLIIDKLIKK